MGGVGLPKGNGGVGLYPREKGGLCLLEGEGVGVGLPQGSILRPIVTPGCLYTLISRHEIKSTGENSILYSMQYRTLK